MRSFANNRSVLQIARILVIAALFHVAGCGNQGPPKAAVYPVSGKITGSTGDLAGCIITFHPTNPSGLSATATIDASGSYSLASIDGRYGCAPGSYKVTFTISPEATKDAMMKAMKSGTAGKSGPPKTEPPFPAKYQKPETSDKIIEVKPETNILDIAI